MKSFSIALLVLLAITTSMDRVLAGSQDPQPIIVDPGSFGDPGTFTTSPQVAHDLVRNRYLVTWEEKSGIPHVRGRFVSADGVPGRRVILLECGEISQSLQEFGPPAITYNSAERRFYVVAKRDFRFAQIRPGPPRPGLPDTVDVATADIVLQVLDENGDKVGSCVRVKTPNVANTDVSDIAVASSYNAGCCILVTWSDGRGSILGRHMFTDGRPLGNDFIIAARRDLNRSDPRVPSAITFSKSAERGGFYVTYGGVSVDLVRVDHKTPTVFQDESVRVYVARNASTVLDPSIAYNERSNRIMLAWKDEMKPMAAIVKGSGLFVLGDIVDLCSVCAVPQGNVRHDAIDHPAVVARLNSGGFAVAYTTGRYRLVQSNGNTERIGFDLRAQIIELAGQTLNAVLDDRDFPKRSTAERYHNVTIAASSKPKQLFAAWEYHYRPVTVGLPLGEPPFRDGPDIWSSVLAGPWQ